MQKQPIIPISFDYLFDDAESRLFAEYILNYILFDQKPKITPAIWQDAEIYIRYQKRNVWSLTKDQFACANRAFLLYRVKYIITHFTKAEILKILNQFFTQDFDDHKSLLELIEQKLPAPIDSLFFTQEKITVGKEMQKNFDAIFDYPSWLEFTDEANQAIFKKILSDELTDEQIDYYLGASDDFKDYDQWFKVTKHVLMTTNNFHVFWTAGDVLSVIRRAAPKDEKSKKWFNDQIYEIFWPRVQSIWPMQNEDYINFETNQKSHILEDSINWLRTLDDLKERLPELGKDYPLLEYDTDETEFENTKRHILYNIKHQPDDIHRIMDLFVELSDCACNQSHIDDLETIAKNQLAPLTKNPPEGVDKERLNEFIKDAIKHAKNYLTSLERERENLAKRLIK